MFKKDIALDNMLHPWWSYVWLPSSTVLAFFIFRYQNNKASTSNRRPTAILTPAIIAELLELPVM
ncbi:hypothetical protein Hdeb2414_s0273g00853751 [Helianthus debilis subsp. tardiflorus]